MRIITRWHFTQAEINWLGDHALTNPLAADILARYNLRYNRGRNYRLWRKLHIRKQLDEELAAAGADVAVETV